MRRTSRPLFARLLVTALAGFAAACGTDPATGPMSAALEAAHSHDPGTPMAISATSMPMLPNDIIATHSGVNVYNGGFGSALDQRGGHDVFYSLTDRGPNVGGIGSSKLFAVPDFHPQVGRFHVKHGQLIRDQVIVLKDAVGNPRTGLPVGPAGCGATGEIPLALDGSPLPFDPNGIDSEGLRVMGDGSFWVSDEYGPFLIHFDRRGRTIERDSPCGGPHPLPAVLSLRQPNKGMEGLAALEDGHLLVGMIQNPLDNPNHTAGKASRLLRILFFDTRNGKTKQLPYLLDNASYGVSEIEAVSPNYFLVDERDGKFYNDPSAPSVQKKVYLIDIRGATDITDPANGPNGLLLGGKTLEQMSDADLVADHVTPVKKTLVVDLLAFGYPHDKAEGVALSDDGRTIAVSNDDDFGVTDDGHQHIIQKLLPSGAVDHNEIWFFRLDRSLHDLH